MESPRCCRCVCCFAEAEAGVCSSGTSWWTVKQNAVFSLCALVSRHIFECHYLPVSTLVCLNIRFWKALAGILPQKGQRGLIPHLGVSAVCHSSSAEFGRSQLKILSYYLPRANFIALVFCGGKEMDKNREISSLII